MSLNCLIERTTGQFARFFDQPPSYTVAAPGRVNVIGEHTDYNDGFVLPMAIDRYTVIAARKNRHRTVTLHSVTTGETATFGLASPMQKGKPHWSNYARGVIAGFQRRGLRPAGIDAVIASEVPLGGGLSSSAALEVAFATLLEAMLKQTLSPMEKVLLCQKAEHEFAGVPCGIMDQMTSVLGKANKLLLIDCRSGRVKYVPFDGSAFTVLIINTNVRHKLAESAYSQRRQECEQAARVLGVSALRDATVRKLNASRKRMDEILFRRARHVISENERTRQAARACSAEDWNRLGKLMYSSHASLRDDFEVSCSELDVVVEVAKQIGSKGGILGCRMTGGGFGGCAIALVRKDSVDEIAHRVAEEYEMRTRIIPTFFTALPASGALIVKA